MADDDERDHPHAHLGIPIPVGMAEQIMRQHETSRARMEDRHNTAMRWLDSLDVDGLMSLRYILAADSDDAYGNNRFYDGQVVQLLRAKGVDPTTGIDPAAQLLESGNTAAGPGGEPSAAL